MNVITKARINTRRIDCATTTALMMAKALLVHQGLTLNTELTGEFAVVLNSANLNITCDTDDDVVVINAPIRSGKLDLFRTEVHSELKGQLILTQSFKATPVAIYRYSKLLKNVDKVYSDMVKEKASRTKRSILENKVRTITAELKRPSLNTVVEEALKRDLTRLNKELENL